MSAHRTDRRAPHEVYDEDAFRHFLAIERRRAERAGRSLLLLLVDIRSEPNGSRSIDAPAAEALFSALAMSVRESDVIGWYRTGRSAGAVVTQGANGPAADVSRQIGERVAAVLSKHLPSRLRACFEVRVLQLQAPQKNRHA
ncbi:MAG: hypothetical protein GEU99_26445 [Luteitalea sp.]|nr:hypothetical protein [Luteitalea sp.]